MTRVKICGITNHEDARAAVEYGAHALGFILVPESPRCALRFGDISELTRQVPPFVTRVAVVRHVDVAADLPRGVFDAVQFYEGDAPAGGSTRWIRGFRIRDAASLEEIARYEAGADALLLDAYHAAKLGGSGETFDWDLACEARARFRKPVILAGGLTPDNVADAVRAVRPYAVDVSSGVEAEPGRKDHARLRAFLRAVRRADAEAEP